MIIGRADMTLLEYFDQDKEKLKTSLHRAGTPEGAVKVLEDEADRLLYQFNEDCQDEALREFAAVIMRIVRMAAPLVHSEGEATIWEMGTGERGSGTKSAHGGAAARKGVAGGAFRRKLRVLLLVAGLVSLLLAALLPVFTDEDFLREIPAGAFLILLAAGAAALFFAGFSWRSFGREERWDQREQKVEIAVDEDQIFRSFRGILITADKEIADRAGALALARRKAGETGEKPTLTAQEAGGAAPVVNMDARQLELFSELLEAAASEDAGYALDKLQDVKYYLHTRGIEAVDYTEENAALFDTMPGRKDGTIRPALVAGNHLLKKGLAARR
jgi:hypothetical protein